MAVSTRPSSSRVTRRLLLKTASLATAGLLVSSHGSPTAAQTASYSVSILRDLTLEGPPTVVGLQDDGALVFNVDLNGSSTVYRWLNGSSVQLGGTGGDVTATSVSDEGIVTGWSGIPSSGTPTPGPEPVLIGADNLVYMPGGVTGYALGSNVTETIVGSQSSGSVTLLPTRWTTSDAIALGLPIGFPTGEAVDINILDQIVGWVGDFESGTQQGVLWEDDAPVLMGTLGGASSTAIKINDSGLAVGYSTLSAGDNDLEASATGAFQWLAREMMALPSLGGATQHRPTDLNETNLITGTATMENGDTTAVIWSAGAIDDLNTLIPVDAGVRLTEAFSTNRFGSILCAGTDAEGADVIAILDVLGN